MTDAFIAKLNPSGTGLGYSTFLGGSYSQSAAGIKVDTGGNAYVTGSTQSTNFPVTTGAYATTLPGGRAAFVTKLNPSGSQLAYSTFLGGNSYDSGNAIVLDTSNNAYIAGTAESANFPTSVGAYQTSSKPGNYSAAFVAEISADGATLKASTYFGGDPNVNGITYTYGLAIALDASNNPYVTGYTNSQSFPVTSNPMAIASLSMYNEIAFVAKMNATLSSLVYSFYVGDPLSGTEAGTIAVDHSGNAYVAGTTYSPDFATTPGFLITQKNPLYSDPSPFLAEFNSSGTSLLYSTLFGGTGTDYATVIALDGSGGVYLAGQTGSTDLPVTPGALQIVPKTIPSGTNTPFVAKFDFNSQLFCTISVTPTFYQAPLTGGTSSFAVTAPQGCPWAVSDNYTAKVITYNSPSHGFGNGTVNFTLASNAGSIFGLYETLSVGPASFVIAQPSGLCPAPSLSPTLATFSSLGGTGQITVSTPSGCPFTSNVTVPWLTITSGSAGTTNGTVSYVVDRDDFAARTTTLSIGGANFSVGQAGAGCVASASLVSGTGGAGGTGSIMLTTSSNSCVWKAYSLASWIQLSVNTGTGSGNAGFTIAPNPGTAPRTGQIQIAGQTVTLTQSAGPFGTPTAYSISTIAGVGYNGPYGDGGAATSAYLGYPLGLAFDAIGNLYLADSQNYKVRKIGVDGTISTVAGNGSSTESGDGGAATAAGLSYPTSISVGTAGELYIAGQNSNNIRKVANSIISTFVAGSNPLYSLANDAAGNIYAGGNGFIEKISLLGSVNIIAGTPNTSPEYGNGDGGPATSATMGGIFALAIDSASNIYLADEDYERVRRISGNIISTVAGTGIQGFNGDGPGVSVILNSPAGLAADLSGNLLIVDAYNYRVRRLTPSGVLSTIAGSGRTYDGRIDPNTTGDGGPALSAAFGYIAGIAISPSGSIALSDQGGDVIRLLTPSSYAFCTYSLSAAAATVFSTGTSTTPTVTTTPGCLYNVFSNANWITPASSTGTGSGSATLQIAANTTGSSRTGAVSIAGQTFTVTQPASTVSVVSAVSVIPSSGSGNSQFFTGSFSDSAGATALNRRILLISTTTSNANACFLQYDPTGIYLANDAGSSLLGPFSHTGTLSNSQCTLIGSGTAQTSGGNSQSIQFDLTFTPAFVGLKTIYLYADDASGINTGYQPFGTFQVTNQPPVGLYFVPIAPCRLADTRTAQGPFGAPSIAGQSTRNFTVPNAACNIPASAQSYSLNVTVVPPAPLGYLTLWPAGQAQPLVSTLNSDGRVKSNAAIVPAGVGGVISVFASNTTDLVLDINGYFVSPPTANALAFYPLTPCRVSDTRLTNGSFGGPYIAGQTSRTIPVRSSACGIPSTAQAYSLNLTAIPRGTLGYLTAFPTGQTLPATSSLNAVTGAVTANAAIVLGGNQGSIDVFASNDADLAIDINGYFAPPGAGGGLAFYNLAPCRALDTRTSGTLQPITGAQTVGLSCGSIYYSATYVFNATTVPSGPLGYLTMWTQNTAQPPVSTLNAIDGAVTGNMAIVFTTTPNLNVFLTNPSHLILDIFGYFAP